MGMREEEAEINMSEITVDCQGSGTSSSDPLEDCYRAEWTNEKHWLYLKSMEASFVNQLRSSMAQPRNEFDLPQIQTETCGDILGCGKSGCEFKYGSGSGASHSRVASHWIRRYRHRGKNHVLEATISRTTHSVLCRKNAVANNTEMMGQNFESNTRTEKRKKIEKTSNEDNDQVVPISRPKNMRRTR